MCALCCGSIPPGALQSLQCAALSKLNDKAGEVYTALSKAFMVDYDDAGSIGKRYRRQDERSAPSASPTTSIRWKMAVSLSATGIPWPRAD